MFFVNPAVAEISDVTNAQSELEHRCEHFVSLIKELKNKDNISSEELKSLESAGFTIHYWCVKRHKYVDKILTAERKFENQKEGYKDWLYESETNVQGFEADITHYKECLNFSMLNCMELLQILRFLDKIESKESWGRDWLNVSPEVKLIKRLLKDFLQQQKKLDEEYLIPIIKNQIDAHNKWYVGTGL